MERDLYRRTKNLAVFFIAAVLVLTFSPAPASSQAWRIIPPTEELQQPPDNNAPAAEIDDLRVYPDRLGLDAFGLSRYGLAVALNFKVKHMAGQTGRIDIFFRPQGGDFISGGQGFYASIEGYVSVRRPFKCLTDDDSYKDVALFIPQEEMRLREGSYTLEAVVLLRSSDRLLSKAVFAFPYQHKIHRGPGWGD